MSDQRTVVEARGADEAQALLDRSFPGATVIADGGDPPVLRSIAQSAGPVRSVELQLRGSLAASGTVRPGAVVAGSVLTGRLDMVLPRHRLDATGPFLRPTGPMTLKLRDAHVRFVEVDTDRFRAAAERVAVEEGAARRLLRTRPVSDAGAVAWRWTADRVHEVLERGPAGNPIVQQALFDQVVRMLLACFGEPVLRGAEGDVREAPRAVRRAVAMLEEHAGGVVTMPQVADAVGVSPRSLQVLFRRHLGTTPLGYLQTVRLESARRDLLGGSAGSPPSVHEIAERWGFGNSGRFARLYADRFGERPSETLRLG